MAASPPPTSRRNRSRRPLRGVAPTFGGYHHSVVAFGVGQWPHGASGAFGDWKPVLLVIVSLLLLRFLVQLEMGWPTALFAIGMGTVWGSLIDWWGVLPPTAIVLLLIAAAASAADRIRHRPV